MDLITSSNFEKDDSVSVDMKIRIIINISENHIFLLKLGNHQQVY